MFIGPFEQPTGPDPNAQPVAAPPPAAAAPAAPAPAAPAAPAPAVVAAPPARGGLAGMLDTIAQFIDGRDKPVVVIDPDTGQRRVDRKPMTSGENWRHIGLEALTGAARASGVRPGPGAIGRGAAAAVGGAVEDRQQENQRQDQQAETDFARQQQTKMQNINYRLLTQQVAQNTFTQAQQKIKASEDMIKFADYQTKHEQELGSYDLGIYDSHLSLPEIIKKQPEIFNKLNQQALVAVPVYNPDGTTKGLQVFERRPGINQTKAEGKLYQLVPGEKPGDPPQTKISTPLNMSAGELQTANAKYLTDLQTQTTKQSDASLKAAQTKAATANAAESYASAGEKRAQTKKIEAETVPTDDDSIVKGMLDNTVDIRKLASLRADHRENLVRKARAINPNFDEKKYENAMDLIDDARSGDTSKAIQSFNRFAGHANQLSQAVNALRNSNSKWLNKPVNAITEGTVGSVPLADYRQFSNAAANEHMNFLLNGKAPHDEDVKNRDKAFNESMSPAAQQGAIKSMLRVQLTQLGTVAKRYEKTVDKAPEGWVDDETKRIIREHGLEDFAKKELGAAYSGPMKRDADAPSQKIVSLAQAKALPQNQGKSDAQIQADIESHGYKVAP